MSLPDPFDPIAPKAMADERQMTKGYTGREDAPDRLPLRCPDFAPDQDLTETGCRGLGAFLHYLDG
jgi:hypothetical protein